MQQWIFVLVLWCSHLRLEAARPWTDSRQLLQANPVSEIIVLGDSYSDVARLFSMTNGTRPDPRWYWDGRYSNGPNWAEYLYWSANGQPYAVNTSFPIATGNPTLSGLTYTPAAPGGKPLKVLSLAVGGSPACEANRHFNPPEGGNETILVPWLDLQVNDFQAILNGTGAGINGSIGNSSMELGPADQRLVILEFGGNDYLNQFKNITATGDFNLELPQLPMQIANCIQAGAKRLLDMGEKNLMLFTLPAIDRSPQVSFLDIEKLTGFVRSQAQRFNEALKQAIGQLQANYTGAHIYIYELGNATAQYLDHPERYNFTNTEDSCLHYTTSVGDVLGHVPLIGDALQNAVNKLFGSKIDGRCDQEYGYTWFDRVHPTTHVHSLLAQDVAAHLQLYGLR